MKKTAALLLSLFMLILLAACGSSEAESERSRVEDGQAASEESPDTDSAGRNAAAESVILINAEIEDKSTEGVHDGEELKVRALLSEGMALDYWKLNGRRCESRDAGFSFICSGTVVVEAVLRPEYTISSVNARMQLLDTEGRPGGESFTSFNFEKDYENSLTAEIMPGGSISVNVKADIPEGCELDYWLINGAAYHADKLPEEFTAMHLRESTVYKAVFKKSPEPSKEISPAAEPEPEQEYPSEEAFYESAQPEPESSAEETFQTTPETVYYNVSCSGCSFSGGGTGGSSGRVPAGTTITVQSSCGDSVWWEGSYSTPWNQPAAASFSYTVNSDCSFTAVSVVS